MDELERSEKRISRSERRGVKSRMQNFLMFLPNMVVLLGRMLKDARVLTAEKALFLVASTSGSTLEVTSLERHFWRVMVDGVGPSQARRHFVAITDPGTSLESHAVEQQYRQIFVNPADIGGRRNT